MIEAIPFSAKVLLGTGLAAAVGWCSVSMPLQEARVSDRITPESTAPIVQTLSQVKVSEGRTITDFSAAGEGDRWRAVNDGVMGGVSQGSFQVSDGVGRFSGDISLENNGGFSSVRRDSEDFDFSGARAIALRVRGDGRRYQLRLKADDTNNSLSYRAFFDTRAGEWLIVEIPLSSFEPVFRGRVVADAPLISSAEIQQIGFLLADKNSGGFALETDWIRAYYFQ